MIGDRAPCGNRMRPAFAARRTLRTLRSGTAARAGSVTGRGDIRTPREGAASSRLARSVRRPEAACKHHASDFVRRWGDASRGA